MVYRASHRRLREETGVNLVEFAVILPVFLLIIFGIIDFGRVIYQYNLIANSAREGARIAIVQESAGGPNEAYIKQRVVDMAVSGLSLDEVTVSGPRTCSVNSCETVKVSVSHDFIPVTPFIGTIKLKAVSSMRVER